MANWNILVAVKEIKWDFVSSGERKQWRSKKMKLMEKRLEHLAIEGKSPVFVKFY